MGVEWAEKSRAAAEIFRRASAAAGIDLLELCRSGPAERLTRTDGCQPAILATSAACLAAVEESGAFDRSSASCALGLSLGEYTALYAAGAFELEDAVKLVRLRGIAMQEASDRTPSGMTSLLGADREAAEEICRAAAAGGGVCVVANLNAPGQVVISGDRQALDRAERIAAERGFRRAVRLEVAGAFHSPVMEPARARLEGAIAATRFRDARFPVLGNVTAEPATDAATLKANLVRQLTAPVLFEASIRRAIALGVKRFVELGPGRVLTGLVKKVDRGFPIETLEGGAA